MASPGKQFKDLMYAPEILIQPGIYDGYTARLVEHAVSRRPRFPARACRKAAWAGPTAA